MLLKAHIECELGGFELEREHSWYTEGGGWLSAQSYLFICPRCSDLWGHAMLEEEKIHWPQPMVCSNCTPIEGCAPPGSILYERGAHVIDEALLNALPFDLLKREFDLTMKYLGKCTPLVLTP